MKAPTRHEHRPFPPRGPHDYALLVDGIEFFPAMLAAIAGARQHVLLEMYLWESGRVSDLFVNALGAAAQRGVRVHILLDDFGSRGMNGGDRKRLREQGAELAFYNPVHHRQLRLMLKRDHRKLLTVDGRVAFVGGACITDDFDPASSSAPAWHDLMLRIRGPCVTDWEALFAATWRFAVGQPISAIVERPSLDGPAPAQRREDGRVVGSAKAGAPAIMRTLISRTRKSRHRIWIATAYFAPTRRLRRALMRAARNGRDVRLLLAGPETDLSGVRHAGRRFYGRLLRSGVRIFEYQPACLHAKFALCDDWATIGSSNFDHWTLRWNLEANQEVMDSDVIGRLAMLFQHDLSLSREWTREAWRQRGWRARLFERFFGALDAWLMRIRPRSPAGSPVSGRGRHPDQGPERP